MAVNICHGIAINMCVHKKSKQSKSAKGKKSKNINPVSLDDIRAPFKQTPVLAAAPDAIVVTVKSVASETPATVDVAPVAAASTPASSIASVATIPDVMAAPAASVEGAAPEQLQPADAAAAAASAVIPAVPVALTIPKAMPLFSKPPRSWSLGLSYYPPPRPSCSDLLESVLMSRPPPRTLCIRTEPGSKAAAICSSTGRILDKWHSTWRQQQQQQATLAVSLRVVVLPALLTPLVVLLPLLVMASVLRAKKLKRVDVVSPASTTAAADATTSCAPQPAPESIPEQPTAAIVIPAAPAAAKTAPKPAVCPIIRMGRMSSGLPGCRLPRDQAAPLPPVASSVQQPNTATVVTPDAAAAAAAAAAVMPATIKCALPQPSTTSSPHAAAMPIADGPSSPGTPPQPSPEGAASPIDSTTAPPPGWDTSFAANVSLPSSQTRPKPSAALTPVPEEEELMPPLPSDDDFMSALTTNNCLPPLPESHEEEEEPQLSPSASSSAGTASVLLSSNSSSSTDSLLHLLLNSTSNTSSSGLPRPQSNNTTSSSTSTSSTTTTTGGGTTSTSSSSSSSLSAMMAALTAFPLPHEALPQGAGAGEPEFTDSADEAESVNSASKPETEASDDEEDGKVSVRDFIDHAQTNWHPMELCSTVAVSVTAVTAPAGGPNEDLGVMTIKQVDHKSARDPTGVMVTNERAAAKLLPVSPLLAPNVAFGGDVVSISHFGRYAGPTVEQWTHMEDIDEQALLNATNVLKAQGYMSEDRRADILADKVLQRVEPFLRLLACALLQIQILQGIDLAYVDWKPNNMCWNAEHKLFVLIDFGLVCALNVPPEQRAVGCSPGFHDTRAFGPRGKPMMANLAWMGRIQGRTNDLLLALLTCLKALNHRYPGPYEQCMQALTRLSKKVGEKAQIEMWRNAIMWRLGRKLRKWLRTLSIDDPMFTLIRDSHPQLCGLIVRAFSAHTSERAHLDEWLQLPELAPMLAEVQQRVDAAMPAVVQQTAAIRSLEELVFDEHSTPEHGLRAYAAKLQAELAAQKAREELAAQQAKEEEENSSGSSDGQGNPTTAAAAAQQQLLQRIECQRFGGFGPVQGWAPFGPQCADVTG